MNAEIDDQELRSGIAAAQTEEAGSTSILLATGWNFDWISPVSADRTQ